VKLLSEATEIDIYS